MFDPRDYFSSVLVDYPFDVVLGGMCFDPFKIELKACFKFRRGRFKQKLSKDLKGNQIADVLLLKQI